MTEGSTCLKYFPWFKEVLPKAVISDIDLKLYSHLLISSMSNSHWATVDQYSSLSPAET